MKQQKCILITGCSSGIGLAAAKTLAARGYRVFATVRQEKDIQPLLDLGLDNLDALQLDLCDSHSIQTAVTEILKRSNGRLYALFNNGAYGQAGAVEDLTREVLREQFETNLFGWHELTRMMIPVMRAQHEGRIIQNSSVLGFVALAYRGAYNASKYALEGLTDTLRLELRDSGIQLSIIEPGPIESQFRKNAYASYQRNIDRDSSVHKQHYMALEKRLTKQGAAVPFTLSADAVVDKLIHALESKRPKIRYYVTFPTYLFATLRHLLPYRWMDWLLNRIG
ncbi:MAG TPA: SDR family oxidoreductase [Gammaproteobacteria bacterium]|nr:SDR family oxidoreductase [Gammaproteobacteria bacterium]